jgi:hypothetical protein
MSRQGVTSRLDFGVQATPGFAGLDVKWNFVRGDVDLAIAPEIDFGPTLGVPDSFTVRGKLPLFFGLNVSQAVSIVLVPSVYVEPHMVCVSPPASDATCDRAGWETVAGTSVGMLARVAPRLALQPGVTIRRAFRAREDGLPPWSAVAGMGFTFGRSSEYESPE